MAFGFAGAGAGASQALEQILAEQMMRAQMAAREREAQARTQLDRDRLTESARQSDVDAGQRQQTIDLGERRRRDDNNDRGLDLMQRDKAQMDQDAIMESLPPRLKQIADLRRVGVSGISPQDLQTPEETAAARKAKDDADVSKAVRIRNATKEPPKPNYERVVVDGKETFLTPEEVRARGGVDAASRKRVATGSERQTLNFYNRMKSALEDMDATEDHLSENDVMLINNSPLPDLINNRLLSTAGQQYAQALRTYTEARLRKESGAAIQQFEYEGDRKAIARQGGDKPDNLAQKRSTRKLTAEGVGYAAGPAYEEFYGEPFKRSQSFSVKAPNGKTYTFDSAEQMAAFKKQAGIP